MKGNLRHFWCYRVGNYRIITDIVDQRLIIEIIQIGHRRKIYH
ncbi:MAG: type II toxin-antitoxin system RelE family toxin [Janthinobacterium lividum]